MDEIRDRLVCGGRECCGKISGARVYVHTHAFLCCLLFDLAQSCVWWCSPLARVLRRRYACSHNHGLRDSAARLRTHATYTHQNIEQCTHILIVGHYFLWQPQARRTFISLSLSLSLPLTHTHKQTHIHINTCLQGLICCCKSRHMPQNWRACSTKGIPLFGVWPCLSGYI